MTKIERIIKIENRLKLTQAQSWWFRLVIYYGSVDPDLGHNGKKPQQRTIARLVKLGLIKKDVYSPRYRPTYAVSWYILPENQVGMSWFLSQLGLARAS